MKILVSALEASSNLHLSEVRKYLKDVEFVGIYEFEDARGIYTPKDFSVMGFVEVIKKIFFIKKAFNQMLDLAREVETILLLDSSSFHIPLSKAIKKRYPHKRIIYYILPQVWAWKPWRVKSLKTYCDELYAILPFEVEMYGGRAEYIGHPLLDELTLQKQRCSFEGSVVFMPGSRRGEISRIFPVLCEVARRLSGEKKVLVVPSFLKGENLGEIYGDGLQEFEISYDANEALYKAKFAFICSGTATLQSAIIGTPFVLCYKAKKLDEWIVRNLIKIDFIGLANILASHYGEGAMHQELIQQDCNTQKLLEAYKEMDFEEFFAKTQKLKSYLQYGSSENLAKKILQNTGEIKG